MSAHVQQLDGRIDGRGKILVGLANQHDLSIMNLSEKCRGKVTRTQGGKSTTIDYVLCNAPADKNIFDMHIDENKEVLHWSDHNLITTQIGRKKSKLTPFKVRVEQRQSPKN